MRSPSALALILEDSNNGSSIESLNATVATLGEAERSAFDRALRTIQTGASAALPGAVQGASTGAVAGPWGALIGGLAGGATTLATSASSKGAPRSPAVQQQSKAANPGAQLTSHPPASATTQQADVNAAAQLLAVVQNPQLLQALGALLAGPSGRQAVPAGQSSAPPAAFLTLLQVLAQKAASQTGSTATKSTDAYLRGNDGEYAWDPASPEERSRALLSRLLSDESSESAWRRQAEPGHWLLDSGLAELIETAIS